MKSYFKKLAFWKKSQNNVAHGAEPALDRPLEVAEASIERAPSVGAQDQAVPEYNQGLLDVSNSPNTPEPLAASGTEGPTEGPQSITTGSAHPDLSSVNPPEEILSKQSLFKRIKNKLSNNKPNDTLSNPLDENVPENGNSVKVSYLSKLKDTFSVGNSSTAAPIRILIGYLPEVTERDALEYAAGMAEKYFDQIGMAFIDAFKYSDGYVYEIHEGGEGKAYTPSILEYFDEQGEFTTGEFVAVVLKTATRKVEVKRLRAGLVSVLLPETSTAPISDFITAKVSMNPAFPKRTGFLVAGAVLFVVSFMAMLISALVARYQPYTPAPPATVEHISANDLPSGQWNRVLISSQSGQVKALRFKNKKWDVEVDQSAVAPEVVPPSGSVASAPEPSASSTVSTTTSQ